LFDLGDGVACVEFHTKMNSLDTDIVNLLGQAMDCAVSDFDGLVIGNEGEHFSAGANLFVVVMAAQGGMWDQIEAELKKGQDMHMRMRYFPKPVVVAPAGMALGGGAEMPMHASRIVAASELYIGLVEIGPGVIPAWGGTKEMVRRILNPPMLTKNAEALPYLQRIFEQVGMAKVSTSAEEATMGILGPADRVMMNRDHLLQAKPRGAACQAGYRPHCLRRFMLPGDPGGDAVGST
jgi:3-hydroxyacyl-CoA dehydrogenase